MERVRRIEELEAELNDRATAAEQKLAAEYAAIRARLLEDYVPEREKIVTEMREEYKSLLLDSKIPEDEHGCWSLSSTFFKQHGQAYLVQDTQMAAQLAVMQSEMLSEDQKN